jgi:hypothetical protein
MKSRIYGVFEGLFRVSLCLMLLFGALLTLGQLAGVLALQPEWVRWSHAIFFKPAMTAAATFGMLAFIATYFRPDE